MVEIPILYSLASWLSLLSDGLAVILANKLFLSSFLPDSKLIFLDIDSPKTFL